MSQEKATLEKLGEAWDAFLLIQGKRPDEEQDMVNLMHAAQRLVSTIRLRKTEPEFFGIPHMVSFKDNFHNTQEKRPEPSNVFPGITSFMHPTSVKAINETFSNSFEIRKRPEGDTPTDLTKGEIEAMKDGWKVAPEGEGIPDGFLSITLNNKQYYKNPTQ